MTLALHGHHALLIATLAFIAAVLTPYWYTSPNQTLHIDIFKICNSSSIPSQCPWTYSLLANNSHFGSINLVYPIVISSCALGCVLISFIGLVLGSWYLQRHTDEHNATWLLVLTLILVFLSFLLSCAVWTIILTTNLQHDNLSNYKVRLADFGFSFWINIGSSVAYLYTFILYLISVCQG
ncbi:unnamed protein product [Adineta ricciae]|uniref:Uncharacterized protein n=1 Tax=Adineta ricciae TaxID=249248 RepID=A0A815LIX5_ADIRI|nr:unnamed protein product [Adineta ricciae]CAF1410802.1 unnamed protein product [Adineta ricciae]